MAVPSTFDLVREPGGPTLLTYEGGTVCDDGFSKDTDGNAICKELGYSSALSVDSELRYDWQSELNINLDDVSCSNTRRWSDCTFRTIDNCNHNEDVLLSCNCK